MNNGQNTTNSMHEPAALPLRMMAYASLMAALIAAGAAIHIPLGPVPIVLQNMFVFLSGLLLGSRWGLVSVAVYLLAGFAGLPVFAGGGSGLQHLAKPTAGFLLGYIPAVFVAGMIAERGRSMVADASAMILATVILYTCGVPWLSKMTGMGLSKSLLAMAPFLIVDAFKIAAALPIAKAIRPVLKR